jgi:hypothetical protein
MNVLLTAWDTKPEAHQGDVPTSLTDTQNVFLCRGGVLCEVREFGQGGLEVISSSLRHYPGEQRVVGRQVAQTCDVGMDPARDDLEKGRRRGATLRRSVFAEGLSTASFGGD